MFHLIIILGVPKKHLDEDRMTIERLQIRVAEDSRRIQQLESILEQRDLELQRMREVIWEKQISSIIFCAEIYSYMICLIQITHEKC